MKNLRKAFFILAVMIITVSISDSVCLYAEPDRKDAGSREEKEKENEKQPADLQSWLEEELRSQDGTWAVYIKDLTTGETVSLNDRKMIAASLIKLYIAGAYYEGKENGTIDWSRAGSEEEKQKTEVITEKKKETSSAAGTDKKKKASSGNREQDAKAYIAEYDRKADIMISCSDNDACNALIDLLGKDAVNQFIKDHGYRKTRLTRKMLENTGTENYTSVGECGRVLEEIYSREFVSKKASDAIMKNLKAQERKSKIPAGVPEGVTTANKTGELASVENDTAVIWGKKTTYILCVMSSDLKSTEEARKEIVKISSEVWSAMNGIPETKKKKQ